jgi:pimeloyl-ACP methyl ester carboxylesterase
VATTGTATDSPARQGRLGPRPLPLYLTTAMLNWSGSRLASESLRNGLPAWNHALESVQQDLERQLKDNGEETAGSAAPDEGDAWRDFVAAVDRAILERSQDLLDAILIYRKPPYKRDTEPAPVAAEALLGWYGENQPGRLLWKVAGRTIDPGQISLPSKVIIPSRDRIVPPPSAEPLGGLLPHAETLHVPLGHVGMMASTNAKKAVWEPLGAWMEEYA